MLKSSCWVHPYSTSLLSLCLQVPRTPDLSDNSDAVYPALYIWNQCSFSKSFLSVCSCSFLFSPSLSKQICLTANQLFFHFSICSKVGSIIPFFLWEEFGKLQVSSFIYHNAPVLFLLDWWSILFPFHTWYIDKYLLSIYFGWLVITVLTGILLLSFSNATWFTRLHWSSCNFSS